MLNMLKLIHPVSQPSNLLLAGNKLFMEHTCHSFLMFELGALALQLILKLGYAGCLQGPQPGLQA